MMSYVKVTTRGRYALRLMLDLACQDGRQYVPLKAVSTREDISRRYLEQIVPMLTQAGLLKTVRGPLGGYKLAKKTEEITVADILAVTEASPSHIACLDEPGSCDRSESCPSAELWREVDDLVNRFLSGITLADLVQRKNSMQLPIV